jgi:hypothetical protein
MKQPWIIGLLIALAVAAAVYVYYKPGTTSMMDEETMPTLTQSNSMEDLRKDLEGTQVVIEDSEYSSVTTDINGL